MDNIESRVSELFLKDSAFEIVTAFIQTGFFCEGRVRLNYKGVSIDFDVWVPYNYPLTMPNTDNVSIIFKNSDLVGYPHINQDGSVCFHPEKDDDFVRKFKSELEGLKIWVYDYYLCGKEDEQYTYLLHGNSDDKLTTIYFSENEKTFNIGDFGIFEYGKLNDVSFDVADNDFEIQNFFRIGFGKDAEDKWSSSFQKKIKGMRYSGLWTYIEREPIVDVNHRKSVDKWSELERYLTDDFVKYLYDNFKKLNRNYFFENKLFLIIGYKIPNDTSYEIHWDLIKIARNELPIRSVLIEPEKRINGKYRSEFEPSQISWARSVNANYERFFGRGKLSSKLTSKAILVIGCGALGSTLSEILVRGGCKSIILFDFDRVESGNLCRASYDLTHIGHRKIDALKKRLNDISPYVNVVSIPYKISWLKDLEEQLNKYVDIIFDCSTDPEVTYLLDKTPFSGVSFSLSITNKAKELVCLVGDAKTLKAKHLFDYLDGEPPSFIEGTGCGYPTFEANFNDINLLLNLALNNINANIEKGIVLNTFVIQDKTRNNFKGLDVVGYSHFYEPTTGSHLYVPNNKLEEITKELIVHYPKEFGGVFVGYKHDKVIIVEDILVPDDFENGKTVFVRHPGSLNDRLKNIFEITNGRTNYIGEWHSHPDAPALPSSTDTNAMSEISNNENINNKNPILMIIKIAKDQFDPRPYLYDKKLLPYE